MRRRSVSRARSAGLMRGEDSVKTVWRLGEGPSSESRPNETNLGRGRPDSDSLVSIGGGFGTERLEEMELASEMVSSLSRRRVLDGMLAVWEDCTRDAVCAGYTRRRYGRSGRRRCRCLCRGVRRINRLEESSRVSRCTTGLSASRSCPMKSQEIATGRPVEVRVPLRTYLACQPSNTWCARQKTQKRRSEEMVQRAVQYSLERFHGGSVCYEPEGR